MMQMPRPNLFLPPMGAAQGEPKSDPASTMDLNQSLGQTGIPAGALPQNYGQSTGFTPVDFNPFALEEVAAQGHGEDRFLGHLSKNDVVFPFEWRTPEINAKLEALLGKHLPRFTVGSPHNSINDRTGLPQFDSEGGGEGPGGEGGGNGPGMGSDGGGGGTGAGTGGGGGFGSDNSQGGTQGGPGGIGASPEGAGAGPGPGAGAAVGGNDPSASNPNTNQDTPSVGVKSSTAAEEGASTTVSNTTSKTGLPGFFNDAKVEAQSLATAIANALGVTSAQVGNFAKGALTGALTGGPLGAVTGGFTGVASGELGIPGISDVVGAIGTHGTGTPSSTTADSQGGAGAGNRSNNLTLNQDVFNRLMGDPRFSNLLGGTGTRGSA